MRPFILIFLLSALAQSEPNHKSGHQDTRRPELPKRTISDAMEAKQIQSLSEKEGSEWSSVFCEKEGCTFQHIVNGTVVEEVFIPASLKDKPISAGETQSHESEYPALNSTAEYEAALQKAKASGNRYLMVKFGAPNHNCLSCLRFDQFMATVEMKKFLENKKVGIYTTDVGEFTNPDHIQLAKKLGAQIANDSFHIPFVAVVDLEDPNLKPKTLLNGYFGGVSSEREAKREMNRIQRIIK